NGCRGRTTKRKIKTNGLRATFTASVPRRLSASFRRQRNADDRLVRVDVGDGNNADARRLEDVDGVDADARTDVAGCCGVVPLHVGCDDGSDDAAVASANAVAIPRGRGQHMRDTNWYSDCYSE